ncbi:hypothetical protein [Scytonema sp. PRP1]
MAQSFCYCILTDSGAGQRAIAVGRCPKVAIGKTAHSSKGDRCKRRECY